MYLAWVILIGGTRAILGKARGEHLVILSLIRSTSSSTHSNDFKATSVRKSKEKKQKKGVNRSFVPYSESRFQSCATWLIAAMCRPKGIFDQERNAFMFYYVLERIFLSCGEWLIQPFSTWYAKQWKCIWYHTYLLPLQIHVDKKAYSYLSFYMNRSEKHKADLVTHGLTANPFLKWMK